MLLLWRPQVPLCVISCSWWRRNEAACPVVHQLQHCGALGDPAQVCWCGCVLSAVCQHCVQVVPGVRHRKMLVDRRYGVACRWSFKSRNLVACRFGKVPQGVYCYDHFSDHEKLYLHRRTKPSLRLQLPTEALDQGHSLTPTQVPWPFLWRSIYLGANPWHRVVRTTWYHVPLPHSRWHTHPHTNNGIHCHGWTYRARHSNQHDETSHFQALASQAKPPALALHDHCCHFCGGDHWKCSCKVLKEYVHDGKCILHDDGHIVLPGGCFIPDSITWKTFREHLDKWHQQNLTSTSTANMLLLDVSPNSTVGILQLSSEEHILSLEKELFALCACELAPGVWTQAQKARNPDPPTDTLTPAKETYTRSGTSTSSTSPTAGTSSSMSSTSTCHTRGSWQRWRAPSTPICQS